ncbi:MAG: hypothetical protein ACI8W7_003055 [Gammaproteobacteria bacterium]|jgi:hypothetical protein
MASMGHLQAQLIANEADKPKDPVLNRHLTVDEFVNRSIMVHALGEADGGGGRVARGVFAQH